MIRQRSRRLVVLCLMAWIFAGHWIGVVHAAAMNLPAATVEHGSDAVSPDFDTDKHCLNHLAEAAATLSSEANGQATSCVEKCSTLANGVVNASCLLRDFPVMNAWHRALFPSPPTLGPTPPLPPPRA